MRILMFFFLSLWLFSATLSYAQITENKKSIELFVDSNYRDDILFEAMPFFTIRFRTLDPTLDDALFSDSLLLLQNRVLSKIYVSNIDTLIIENICSGVNIVDFFSHLSSVKTLVVKCFSENGKIHVHPVSIIDKINAMGSVSLNELFLVAENLSIDLSLIDTFRIKQLSILVLNNTYSTALFENKTRTLNSFRINAYSMSTRMFKRTNRCKFPKKMKQFSVGGGIFVPRDEALYPTSYDPHNRKL